jgi:hypothetical protein
MAIRLLKTLNQRRLTVFAYFLGHRRNLSPRRVKAAAPASQFCSG